MAAGASATFHFSLNVDEDTIAPESFAHQKKKNRIKEDISIKSILNYLIRVFYFSSLTTNGAK